MTSGASRKRPAHRHGRVDAVLAGLVGGGQHHAPTAHAPDDHRLPAQLGTPGDLHRGEEGIHVHVQDGAAGVVVAQAGGRLRPGDLAATHRAPLSCICARLS